MIEQWPRISQNSLDEANQCVFGDSPSMP
jgi:hypothetical protein